MLSNQYVAIKVVSKHEHMSIESRTRLVREASIMKSLDHPLMADLFYFMEDESNSYLVMEYLENSSLLDLINNTVEEYEFEEEEEESVDDKNERNTTCTYSNQKSNKNARHFFKIKALDENIVRKIFVQLIVALEFLHNVQHVAHRDIKAENVLLDRYNNIRIIDFGLSAIVQDDNKSLKRTVGSVAYTAPEILLNDPDTYKYDGKSSDVYSFSMILYLIFTGNKLYDKKVIFQIIKELKQNNRPQLPSDFNKSLKYLIESCWENDPQKRMTFNKIIEYFNSQEFITNNNHIIDFAKLRLYQLKIKTYLLHISDSISAVDIEKLFSKFNKS